MQAIQEYIRKEWYIWVGGFFAVLMWCFTNAAMADALLKAEAYDVGFYQDASTNKWYVANDTHISEIKENFDSVKVLWKGRLQNKPIVLISGQRGTLCPMTFRLYWIKDNGDFTEYRDFNTCYAKNVSVKLDQHFVQVTLDRKVIAIGVE
jgi:hypothetical protein